MIRKVTTEKEKGVKKIPLPFYRINLAYSGGFRESYWGFRLGEVHHPIVPCFPYFPTLWICNFCQFDF